MKRLLPAILIAFLCAQPYFGLAQPTLTSANTNLRIGDQFLVNQCLPTAANLTAAGTTGANLTWNFATLSPLMQQTANVLARSAAPNPTSYPAANMVVKVDTDYEYVDNNNIIVKEYALVQSSQNNSVVNTDPANRISFPFTYNSTFTDPFAGSATISGTTIPRNGTITVIANGYGTLVTPAGTFQNVLKVRATEIANQLTPFAETTITYDWFMPGVHFPLLRLSERTVLGTTIYNGFYLDQASSLGLKEDFGSKIGFQVYPNPATSQTILEYKLEKAGPVNITLLNAIGQEVQVLQNGNVPVEKQTTSIPVGTLPKGIYFMKLTTQNQVAARRLVVE